VIIGDGPEPQKTVGKTCWTQNGIPGRHQDSLVNHCESCQALILSGEEALATVPLEVNAAGRPGDRIPWRRRDRNGG